ncbi:MAG: hypothetical protein AB7D57_10895 [Desulfovibrionaceae bacterium]
MVRETLHQIKDKALATAFAALVRERLASYADLRDLRLDSRARRVEAVVLPDGEREPVLLTLTRYAFVAEAGRFYLELGPIEASRPWIERLANDLAPRLFPDRRLDITDKPLAQLLSSIL